jgi:hypothetical protein
MTHSTIVANGLPYVVNVDEPRPTGYVFQAVVVAQLVDALTGTPVRAPYALTTQQPAFTSLAAPDGFVGLGAVPTRVFPALAAAATVPVTISAAGYGDRREIADVPAQLNYPDVFAPADLGTLPMLRRPVALDVTTYGYSGAGVLGRLGGAVVRLSGAWASVDKIAQAADTGVFLAVGPGLAAGRPNGAPIDLPALATPPEPPRTLAAGYPAGAISIDVDRAGALVAGDLVALDLGSAERVERVEVVAVSGAPDWPSRIDLRFPLQHDHPAGSEVVRIAAPPPTAALAHLRTAALSTSRTLALDVLGGLAAGQVVRVSGGSAAPEYVTVDVYERTTDGNGFTRFPPITGLAAVELHATSGARASTELVTLTPPTPARALAMTLR